MRVCVFFNFVCLFMTMRSFEDNSYDECLPSRHIVVSANIVNAFENHAENLRQRKRKRVSDLELRSHLEADQSVAVKVHDSGDSDRVVDEFLFGVWKPGDQFQGDVCLRTLQDLLLKIDRQGCTLR
jgi:hypothetical protein